MQIQKRWPILLVILITAIGITSYFVVKRNQASDLLQHRTELSSKLASAGVMDAPDFVKWQYLTDNVVRTGTISDGDLDWMLHIMDNPQTATNDPQIVHGNVLGTLTHLKQIPKSQEDKIYNAAIPLLSSDKKLDKLYSAKILGKLQDKRAIPHLKPLLKDSDPDVQLLTRRALKKLGYSALASLPV